MTISGKKFTILLLIVMAIVLATSIYFFMTVPPTQIEAIAKTVSHV